MPQFNLSVPENPAHQSYLGLIAKDTFTLPQIKAEVLIIEIFSMYWPYCQKEAPSVNELYHKIENNPKLKGKVKLIGIGAGNSSFEVNTFRKTYKIPFPLFSDGDFSIHKKLGEVRTPYFIGVRINAEGPQKVFFSKLGGFDNPGHFLKEVIRHAGID